MTNFTSYFQPESPSFGGGVGPIHSTSTGFSLGSRTRLYLELDLSTGMLHRHQLGCLAAKSCQFSNPSVEDSFTSHLHSASHPRKCPVTKVGIFCFGGTSSSHPFPVQGWSVVILPHLQKEVAVQWQQWAGQGFWGISRQQEGDSNFGAFFVLRFAISCDIPQSSEILVMGSTRHP